MNPLDIKGVGEIGITGTAGAVENAVWHATSVRVRKFPIILDPLIEPSLLVPHGRADIAPWPCGDMAVSVFA